MIKQHLLVTAAALSIGAGAALAQSSTTTTPVPAAPAAPSMTTPAPSAMPPTGNATTTTGSWYSHQATEMRASKVIGTKVRNGAGETIGDVNEVILGNDGRIHAVVVGVGGFLGIGEREVAVQYDQLRFDRDANGNNVIRMNATKDQLQAAPAWSWRSDTSATGASTGSSGAVNGSSTTLPKR